MPVETKTNGIELYDGEKATYTESQEAIFEDDEIESTGKGGVIGGSLNLTNTVIGSGILGLPYAFDGVGYASGIILVIVSGILSAFTLHLLSKCSNRIGGSNNSYGSVGHHSFPALSWFVDAVVIFNCFGAGVSYLIIFGDNMPDFMEFVAGIDDPNSIWLDRHVWVTVAFVVSGIPLTIAPRLDFLKYTSFLAIVSVVYVMLLVILYWASPNATWDPCDGKSAGCSGPSQAINTDYKEFMKALPVFVFAFCCHFNIFSIYNEIKDQRVRTMDIIIGNSLFICGIMYIVFGLGGYLTYGSETESNILLNFPLNTLSSIARLAISFVVAVSYPLMTHPTRSAGLHLYEIIMNNFGSKQYHSSGKTVYWTVTVVVLAVTYGLAMIVTDLGFVFSLIGATASTMIAFVLPGTFFVKQYQNDPRKTLADKAYYWSAWFFIIFGCCFSVIAVTFQFV
eukprot:CFRG5102T1